MKYPRVREYPKEILVGESIWHVKFKRHLPFIKNKVVGLCDPSDNTIYLLLGQSRREMLITFIHELLHAIEMEYEIEIDHEIIYKIQEPIMMVVIDNFFN